MTEAEKRYYEAKRKRDLEFVKKLAKKSHRERIAV